MENMCAALGRIGRLNHHQVLILLVAEIYLKVKTIAKFRTTLLVAH